MPEVQPVSGCLVVDCRLDVLGDGGGDFEFGDVGSSIEVRPTNVTSSDQQVNQAASAFGS